MASSAQKRSIFSIGLGPIVSAMNYLGRMAEVARLPLVSFTEDKLMAQAKSATGLHDWGDQSFRLALRMLLESLNTDARLNLIGKLGIHQELIRLLSLRLCMQEDFKQHPEIAQIPISRPLFVVGLPRTGTTLLHNLLSADPAARAPLLYELWYPAIPPRWKAQKSNLAKQKTDTVLRWLNLLSPSFSSIHSLASTEPEECFHIFQATFLCVMFEMRGNIHSYITWLLAQDLAPAYQYYRQVLQRLQWKAPEKRWVLKSPVHLFALDKLIQTFADARVIHIHRHPLQVASSCCSMMSASWRIHSDSVSPKQLGAHWLRSWSSGMEMAMKARETINPAQIFDLYYEDLLADPVQAIRRAYQHLGYSFDARMEERITHWLKLNPQHKHGKHRYAPEDFGLSPDDFKRNFAHYLDRFGPFEQASRAAAPSRISTP